MIVREWVIFEDAEGDFAIASMTEEGLEEVNHEDYTGAREHVWSEWEWVDKDLVASLKEGLGITPA
jgi:hypothetical protein